MNKLIISKNIPGKPSFVLKLNEQTIVTKWGMPEIFDTIADMRNFDQDYAKVPVLIDADVFQSVHACFITEEEL